MASVQFPMIRAICDDGHVTEIPLTPDAIETVGGCDCPRDSNGRLEDYCYCSPKRSVVNWHCGQCPAGDTYNTVEVD